MLITASAPGKCILLGEHAVVYGHPALAVAVGLRMSVSISESRAETNLHYLDGRPLVPKKHPHIGGALERLWDSDGERGKLNVLAKSELPASAGLGSSAALSVALSAALIAASNGSSDLDLETISSISHQLEADAQGGLASPLDTSTATHGGCVILGSERLDDSWLYTRKLGERSWEIHGFELPASMNSAYLVIGHTGIHASTAKLVAGVQQRLQVNPALEQEFDAIAALTKLGVQAIQDEDLPALGAVMNLNHRHLQNIGVSCPELDRLVEAARESSLGAKLTGAGGGGCMIALSLEPKSTARAIELAGGRSYICDMGVNGVRIDTSESS